MTAMQSQFASVDFDKTGVAFPVEALATAELQAVQKEYAQLVEAHGGTLKHFDRAHYYFGWAYDLVRHPRIVDAVAALLGDDVLVWGSLILTKPPGDESFIAWHQDGAYAQFLGEAPAVSAWIALTESTVQSGCMRVVPGSQKVKVAHLEKHDPLNMLNRGQEIAVEVDEATAVDVELRAGEMSLHHVDIVHGSNPNRSSQPRTGFIVRYSTPQMLQAVTPVVVARGCSAPHLASFETRPMLSFEEAIHAQRERR
jgi:non-heme Fe2+,alpha-ketoglutarate-dependent halogenase